MLLYGIDSDNIRSIHILDDEITEIDCIITACPA